eukprot:2389163-Pyramimonas_sp.AAC.3
MPGQRRTSAGPVPGQCQVASTATFLFSLWHYLSVRKYFGEESISPGVEMLNKGLTSVSSPRGEGVPPCLQW